MMTLHCQGGHRKDALYTVRMIEAKGKWTVQVEYGARGAAMHVAIKTPRPCSRAEAQKVYDSVIATQLRKGYLPYTGAAVSPCNPRSPPTAPAVSPGSCPSC